MSSLERKKKSDSMSGNELQWTAQLSYYFIYSHLKWDGQWTFNHPAFILDFWHRPLQFCCAGHTPFGTPPFQVAVKLLPRVVFLFLGYARVRRQILTGDFPVISREIAWTLSPRLHETNASSYAIAWEIPPCFHGWGGNFIKGNHKLLWGDKAWKNWPEGDGYF